MEKHFKKNNIFKIFNKISIIISLINKKQIKLCIQFRFKQDYINLILILIILLKYKKNIYK